MLGHPRNTSEEANVRYLVYESTDSNNGSFKVFIDKDLDLDWNCDDKIAASLDVEPLKTASRKILNAVAACEPLVQNWPDDLKLTSKRLLGEAIACAVGGNPAAGQEAFQNAEKYIKAKSLQVSRYWTLQGCLVMGGAAMVLGLLDIGWRPTVTHWLGTMAYLLTLCFWAGSVGALLFFLLRFGNHSGIDSSAERQLHYFEACARIVGGGIAGVLVGSMVKLGLVLPYFNESGMLTLAMCVAAMIAGASERMAAGIVTRVENHENNQKKGPDATNA